MKNLTTFIFSTLIATSATAGEMARVLHVEHRYSTVKTQHPVTQCTTQQVPIYSTQANKGSDNIGSFIVGGLIGSAVGNHISGAAGAGTIGAIVGGALANEHQKKHNTTQTDQVVGFREIENCRTVYESVEQQKYRFSYVLVEYAGKQFKINRHDQSIKSGDYINVDVTVK